MSEGFPLLTTKKVFTKAIVHELLWFINGDTNIKYLEDNGVTIWTSDAYREYNKKVEGLTDERLTKENFSLAIKQNPKFAEMYGELGPIYGRQWRKWTTTQVETVLGDDKRPKSRLKIDSIDQLAEAMNKLLNNPDDRRILVSAWNVAELPYMALPPCHWAFELYTEELTARERMNLSTNYGNTHDIKANWDVSENLNINAPKDITNKNHKDQTVKIKLEVDTNPPLNFQTQNIIRLTPRPFSINAFTLDSLYAGKMHAILCRAWSTKPNIS